MTRLCIKQAYGQRTLTEEMTDSLIEHTEEELKAERLANEEEVARKKRQQMEYGMYR